MFDENGDFKAYTNDENIQQNYTVSNLYYFWKVVEDENFSKTIYFKNGEFGYNNTQEEIIQNDDFDVKTELLELKNIVSELTV